MDVIANAKVGPGRLDLVCIMSGIQIINQYIAKLFQLFMVQSQAYLHKVVPMV
jgi:hypothetical protein